MYGFFKSDQYEEAVERSQVQLRLVHDFVLVDTPGTPSQGYKMVFPILVFPSVTVTETTCADDSAEQYRREVG